MKKILNNAFFNSGFTISGRDCTMVNLCAKPKNQKVYK